MGRSVQGGPYVKRRSFLLAISLLHTVCRLQRVCAIAVLPAPAGPLNHKTLEVREASPIQLIISATIVLRVSG
jgi:hypothetical protein